MDESKKTRRQFLAGSATAGGLLLAGCSGGNGGGTPTETGTGTATATKTTTKTETGYTVTMEPVGDLKFEGPPETVALYHADYADMMVALGHGDAIASVGFKQRFHTQYYDQLDGVSVDKEPMTQLYQGGVSTETFLQIGADLNYIDPNYLINTFGWDQSKLDTVAENTGPFFGNVIYRRTDDWHDYPYYTMYEAFEKTAEIFQEREKYEQFAAFHDEFRSGVRDRLPAESERPNGVVVYAAEDPKKFYPYRIDPDHEGYGTNKKKFHDLGISDAFKGTGVKGLSTSNRATIDYETLLEVDPDTIFVRGHEGKSREAFVNTVVANMKNHDVGQKLTAVQNDAVYRGGPIYEGPIQNLFMTERFAKLVYPDVYTEAELFSRSKVAGIVTAYSNN